MGGSAGGSTTQLDLDASLPTTFGGIAEAEAPTQVMRGATGHGEAAAPANVPVAAETRSRGLFAALGLFATAALVLLALRIGGPGGDVGGSGSYGLEIHESSPPEKMVETVKASEKGKKDDRPPVPPPTLVEPGTATSSAESDATGETGRAAGATSGADDAGEGVTQGASAGAPPTAPPDSQDSSPKQPRKPTIEERIDDGCVAVRAGNAEAGVKILKAAREDRPKNIRLLTCLADGLLKIGEYAAAENFYRQLIVDYPRNKLGYLGAAMANENLARNELAAKYYQQVLLIDPNNKSARAFLSSHGGATSRLPPGGGLDLPD